MTAERPPADQFRAGANRTEITIRTGPVAIFADVHGNLPALEAVMADIAARGAELVVCAGDVVGYGPWPRACIDMLREAGVSVVRGNYDTGIGFNLPDCGCAYPSAAEQADGKASLAWTAAAVTDDHRAWLASLPDFVQVNSSSGLPLVLAFHGSPRRVNEYLYEDRPLSSLERMLAGEPAHIAVCGHTHLPYQRRLSNGRLLVNPGSAGRPKHGRPTACYARLSWPDGLPPSSECGPDPFSPVTVEIIEVPYDHERTAKAVLASGLPKTFAAQIISGGAR